MEAKTTEKGNKHHVYGKLALKGIMLVNEELKYSLMYRKPVWESFFSDPIFKAWDLDEFEINILNAFIQNNYQPIRNNSLLDDYLFQL